MRALLEGLVPGLPGSVIGQIVARAEGIPLYAVEMVRTLLNDGLIQREGDAFRPVGDLDELAVPESLHALIAARIDSLPAAERNLVQDGSVLGQSFGLPALKAVARSDPEDIGPMLQHLVQREIVALDDDPRSPERGNYRFVQGLLREVAYGTLARDDRRTRHLAAARYYEALGDDELSGVLAQHYVDAYQAHPDGPEGAAVAAQARVALRGAAQRAADLGSFRLAHGYIDSALSVTTQASDELDLRIFATDAAANAGLFERAIEHGERVVELATQTGADRERRVGIARLANILVEGRQQQALKLLNDAMSEPGMTPDAPGYIEVATVLAKAEMRQMNDLRAVELADLALPHAQRVGSDALILDLLITRSVSLSNLGRVSEAVVILTGALDVANRLSLADASNRAAVNLGYALAPDDPARAFDVSRAASERAKKDGVIWGLRYVLGNAVDAAIEVGEWDWATEQMRENDPLFTEIAERLWFGAYRAVIGAFRGEEVRDDALRLYAESRSFDDAQYRLLGSYALGVVEMLSGDVARVIQIAKEDLTSGISGADAAIYSARAAIWGGDIDAAREMRSSFQRAGNGRRTRAQAATMDGGIAILEGRRDEARAHYAEAQRILREIGARYWLGMTDLDVVITGAMEPAERSRAGDEAREIFTDLRAAALLERLDAAVSMSPAQSSIEPARMHEGEQISQEA
jgi:tetratricopeptide (TPR) repeat protein